MSVADDRSAVDYHHAYDHPGDDIPHDISLHALLIDTRRRGAGVIHVGFHLDDRLRHCRHVESYTKLH